MSQDITARIRAVLQRDYAGGDCPAAQAVSNALDFMDRFEYGAAVSGDWTVFASMIRSEIGQCLGVSDSPAAAGSQPSTAGGTNVPDWHRIAVQVARYGGSYHGLKTWERDVLEDEVSAENERDWGVGWERRTDAASGGERS